jgi:hypothetical protein
MVGSAGGYVYVGRRVLLENGTMRYSLSMYARITGSEIQDIPVADVGPDQPDFARVEYVVNPSGTLVYAAGPGSLMVINKSTGEYVTHKGVVHYPCDMALSPDGRILYIADIDYTSDPNGVDTLLLVDTKTFTVISREDPSVYPGFEYDRNGHRYLVAGQGRVYFVVNDIDVCRTHILEFVVDEPEKPRLGRCWVSTTTNMLLLSPDGKMLVEVVQRLVGNAPYWNENGFRVYNLTTGQIVKAVPLGLGDGTSISSMTFSPDGDILYVGTFTSTGSGEENSNEIREYYTENYSLARTHKDVCSRAGFGAGAMWISVSPDGDALFYVDRSPINADGTPGGDKLVAEDRITGDKMVLPVDGVVTQIMPDTVGGHPIMLPLEVAEELNPDVEIIIFDPALMNSSQHWMLLAADEGNRRDVRLKYIDDAFAGSGEREAMKAFLETMWMKYPVKFEKNGRRTNVSFDLPTKDVKLADDEEATLGKIEAGINNYMNAKLTATRGTTLPTFTDNEHRNITYDSCIKAGFPYPDIAASAAPQPDTWDPYVPDWGWIPQWLKDFWNQTVHSYNHYYDPFWQTGITVGLGGAPGNAKTYGEEAKAYYDNRQPGFAAQSLGYSSHFTVDVGCPLHTGAELSQYNNQWTHSAYEIDYVFANWSTFYNIVKNNNQYVHTTSIDGTTIDLAKYSNQYCGTVFDTIYNHPDTYKSDPNLRAATENVLLETSKREMGIALYVKS